MNIKRLIMITFLFACYGAGMVGSNKIDRKALVMRHLTSSLFCAII